MGMAHTYVNNEEEEKTQMHVPESHVMLWWILHCLIFSQLCSSLLYFGTHLVPALRHPMMSCSWTNACAIPYTGQKEIHLLQREILILSDTIWISKSGKQVPLWEYYSSLTCPTREFDCIVETAISLINLPHEKVQCPLTAESLQSWGRSQIMISVWFSLWQSFSKPWASLIAAYEN